MDSKDLSTLNEIHTVAKKEFLEKGYAGASLRNIVRQAGMTTGAFYGYYDSKEELFGALVKEHYDHFLSMFRGAQGDFARIPSQEQPEKLASISGDCMFEMLHYAYAHLEEFKLIICSSEGTRYHNLIDEMVDIETEATHAYIKVLEKLGQPKPNIDPRLEHIIITGMFNTFVELIVHEMPVEEAEKYLAEMRAFYTAGWMKILGQR